MNKTKTAIFLIMLYFLTFQVSFSIAQTKDVITLKMATFSGGTNPVHMVIKWWAEELDKRTDGRLKIKIYESGSLSTAKEMLNAASTGFADVAQVTPGYFPARLVISGIPHVPFNTPNRADQFVYAFHNFAENEHFKKEMESLNLSFLWFESSGNYQIMGNKPVRSLKDFEGLKIRATGAYSTLLKEFGATPVYCTTAETYNSISRGVVDVVLGAGSHWMHAYKVDEGSKNGFYTYNLNMGMPYIFYVMNKDIYEKLPIDIRRIMDEVKAEIPKKLQETAYSEEIENRYRKMFSELGIQLIEFPNEDRSKMIAAQEEVSAKWVNDWEAKGRKTKEASGAWKKIMKDVEAKYPNGL